jgi:hypothetical protein
VSAVLREALEEILCCHDGNQPDALNMPDLEYARRIISTIHRIASAALQLDASASSPAEGRAGNLPPDAPLSNLTASTAGGGSSCTDSGSTASPKSDGLCKSEGGEP